MIAYASLKGEPASSKKCNCKKARYFISEIGVQNCTLIFSTTAETPVPGYNRQRKAMSLEFPRGSQEVFTCDIQKNSNTWALKDFFFLVNT